jgi:asparagine synthase (glutamine-hydrolysing)
MNGVIGHRGRWRRFHIEPGVGPSASAPPSSTPKAASAGYNEDHSVVALNGEIFNFQEVEVELVKRGHTFRTRCDTEVIVHAWEEWGVDCLARFNGMFAFALWDKRQKTLFIARDRPGVKPLYYAELADGRIVFGSSPRPRLASDVRAHDPLAVEEYFAFGYVPDPKTIYRDVRKLEPGAYICVKRGEAVKPVRYWEVPLAGERVVTGTPEQWQEELRARLQESVRKRLISDVPLGAFLSGGIDSSAVVAMMREIGGGKILTCSIGFREPQYDESAYARMVAEAKHTDHKAEVVEASDYSLLEKLVDIYDEPYADSSAIPTYRVCQLARRHVTVALSGDGGDEDFIGYRRYRLFAMEERLAQQAAARDSQADLRRARPRLSETRFGTAVRARQDDLPGLGARHRRRLHARDLDRRRAHARSSLQRELPPRVAGLFGWRSVPQSRARQGIQRSARARAVSRLQDLPARRHPDKVDRASMAHSLKSARRSWTTSSWSGRRSRRAVKLRGSEGKAILKRARAVVAARSSLPHQAGLRCAAGHVVPRLAATHLADTVRGERLAGCGIFDRKMWCVSSTIITGRRDHSAILWSLLMFDGSCASRPSRRTFSHPETSRLLMSRRLGIVSVCKSLPNPDHASDGVFVAQRLMAMQEHADVHVIQPVPYMPHACCAACPPGRANPRGSLYMRTSTRRCSMRPGRVFARRRDVAGSRHRGSREPHAQQPIDSRSTRTSVTRKARRACASRAARDPCLHHHPRLRENEFVKRPGVGPQLSRRCARRPAASAPGSFVEVAGDATRRCRGSRSCRPQRDRREPVSSGVRATRHVARNSASIPVSRWSYPSGT